MNSVYTLENSCFTYEWLEVYLPSSMGMRTRILPFIFVLFLHQLSTAQKCPTAKWLQERVVALKSKGPTYSTEIAKDDKLKMTMTKIIGHFEFLGNQKAKGLPKNLAVRSGVKNPWRCERNEDRLADAVKNVIKNFGWRTTYKNGVINPCRSIIKSDDKDFLREMREVGSSVQLFDRITRFGKGIEALGVRIGEAYGLNWERFRRVEERPFDADRFRTCRIVKALGYRVNGSWALAARISNTEVGFEQRDFERITLNEFVIPDGTGGVSSIGVTIPTCKNGLLTGYDSGTASVSSWSGEHTWSHFANFPTNVNPALEDALEMSEFNKELVEDIYNPSSFIALWLPTIVVMVPLALFQDWDPRTSLLYRVVTDVIAILPFASKGAELIYNGSRRKYATVSFVYGADTTTDLAAVETWVAFCEMKQYVFWVGISVLIIIAVEILIGLILERRTRSSLENFVHQSRGRDTEMKPTLLGPQNATSKEDNKTFLISRGNGLLYYLLKTNLRN